MKTITLIVLGLDHTALLNNISNLNGLSLLTSKATRHRSTANYLEILTHALQLPQFAHASIAELTAMYDGFTIGADSWLRADPVELKVDLAAVYMYGNQHLQLTATQIQTIKDKLQPLLNDYHMQLHTTENNRWYLQCAETAAITTTAPETIIGKDIMNFLPKSLGKMNWQKLQMELQMALHQLADNGGVNSIWFWGEGEKLKPTITNSNAKLFSNEPISRGLAAHCQLSASELPQTLTNEKFWQDLIVGGNVIVYDKLTFAQSKTELTANLYQLEQQFIQPLLNALKQSKIQKINIDFLNGISYQFKKNNFYHFWKTKSII